MGIQINGNTNNINAGIGSLSIEDINELDIVGVATAANFKTGISNLHSVGLTLTGGQIDVGSNIKIGTAGVITATSFIGSGSGLTGLNSDLVNDTSPQLGANLDTNTKCIDFGDSNTGTVNRLRFGASTDLEIFHNGTNNHIDCHTAGQDLYIRPTKDVYIQDYTTDDIHIKMIKDGAVELYHDNVKKFSTISAGAYVTGSFGVGAATNPSHNYNQGIHVHAAGTGAVLHLTDNTSGSGAGDGFDILSNAGAAYLWQREDANMVFGTNGNSRWNIYGSNGHFAPSANNTYDIGTSSTRVRNIYTNDLNLSNEGSTNSVDNTWGNYTIQEGESDLFLINNRNGKKYKFNLTEVV